MSDRRGGLIVRRLGCKEDIEKLMSEMQLDALILPINALVSSYAAAGG
jgi:hypothetical protein